jgi:type IV pilus assembly protein PilY1
MCIRDRTKIASLGCDDTSSCVANRKFLFSPDVVEKDGVYYLLVGSGDREKPIRAFTSALDTENHFYMLKDMPSDPAWLSSESSNCGSDILCLDSLVDIGVGADTPEASDLAAAKGWYLDLRDGEQVVTSPITVFGNVTFSTHTPTEPVPGACTSNLGTARVYNVRYLNAAPRPGANNRDQEISGGGLPPSPVAGQVTLDNGVTVPFIIGADASSPLEASLPAGPASGQQPKSLTYWFIEK